jgi:hypothetical protein
MEYSLFRELNVTSGKIDNQNVVYALKKGDPLGVYIASIDLITSNTTSIPDAGAYVSLNVGQSEVPVIIKFEDLNWNVNSMKSWRTALKVGVLGSGSQGNVAQKLQKMMGRYISGHLRLDIII